MKYNTNLLSHYKRYSTELGKVIVKLIIEFIQSQNFFDPLRRLVGKSIIYHIIMDYTCIKITATNWIGILVL